MRRFVTAAYALLVVFWAVSCTYGEEDPVPRLIEKLKQKDAAGRVKAAEALMQIGPDAKDAIPALVDALQDQDPVVRQKAVIAIGLIHAHPEKAVPALRGLLKDQGVIPEREGISIPEAVVVALGNFGSQAKVAVADLVELATGDDYRLKVLAVGSLGQIKADPEKVVPLVIAILEGKNEKFLKGNAATTLAAFGPSPKGVAVLLAALPCQDVEDPQTRIGIRHSIVAALGNMGEHGKPAIPTLIRLVTDRKSQAISPALKAIANLGPVAKDAVPALVQCLSSRDFNSFEFEIADALAKIGDDAVEPLMENLNHPNKFARRFTVRALGRLGPKAARAIPALQTMLADKDVGDDAKEALEQIKQNR